MHAIKREPVTVYFGGSYRETWAADFTLSITYFDRKPVRAVPGENGTWTAQDGDAELCAKINSAPEDSLIHRYFYASAEVYNAVRVCFAARIPAASIHEFLSIENEPIAAAELMRVLMDDCGLSIERAYSTSVQSCGVYREGYTRELKDELMKLQPRTAHVFSIMYESAKNYVAIHFNSSKERFRNPAEAVTCGQRVTMSFDVLSGRVGSAELKLQDGNREYSYPMTRAGDTFTVSFRAPENTGSMTYYMLLRSQGENLYICPDISGYNGIIYREKHPGFRFVVYRPEFTTPSWFRKAVMYQVYPDRFARSDDDTAKRGLEYHRSLGQNPDWHEGWDEPVKYWARPGEASYSPDDFYGGTFKGIESRLDYLRELGISCLYLNPIVESRSNHRYDTSDYMKADPILGTNEDFEHLCSAAKEKGIRVILDGVFSHTGADSLYFNRYGNYPSQGACQGRHSPYYGWYSFQRFPDNYKSWWGFQDLPEVNELNPEWQDFVLSGNDSVVKTWLRKYNRRPDAVIVEGPLCGGHLGFSMDQIEHPETCSMDKLLPEIREVSKKYDMPDLPTLAAEEVACRADIEKFLRMGYDGVQIGTYFITAQEAGIDEKSKQVFINATKDDIVIIKSPVGLPVRVIKTKLVQKVLSGERTPFTCPYRCLRSCNPAQSLFCIARALMATWSGDVDNGLFMCGCNLDAVKKIYPIQEFFDTLAGE